MTREVLKDKKILVIHDRFLFRGGGERLALILARALDADLATEFWMGESFPETAVANELFVLDEGNPKPIVWRYFKAQLNFLFRTRPFIRNYDIVIFSGNNCLTAAFNLPKSIPKVAYIHHPVRYVYDLLEYRRSQESSAIKRFLYYDVGKWPIRFIYSMGLKRMDTLLVNSENVRKRMIKYCHTDAAVVYPPIQTNKFQWIGQENYYLAWGRIDELKRTIDVVKAFQEMPDKKLIVAGSGDLLEEVRVMASMHDNIEVKGVVTDEQLFELVGNCLAFLYIPRDEDFGMIPLEGMSAGKPCIGVDEGGLKETIISGKTGVLIPAEYTTEDIKNAVYQMTAEKALNMKEECIARALQFKEEVFVERMKKAVEKTLANNK